MTAVEWLWNCIPTDLLTDSYIQAIFNQAKKMEKRNIIDAWNDVKICDSGYKDAQQYYNETFKNK